MRRLGWWRALVAVAALALGAWLAVLAAVVVTGRRDSARASAAIVVMGAAQYAGRPSPVLKARLDHAITLYRRGLAPLMIFTGGRGPGDTVTEAEVGRAYARRAGVPDSAMLLETDGRTTVQSLRAVGALLDARRARTLILVSDPFHMLRLSILARQLGLEPRTSPTRTSPISRNRATAWRYVFAESVKVPAAFLLER